MSAACGGEDDPKPAQDMATGADMPADQGVEPTPDMPPDAEMGAMMDMDVIGPDMMPGTDMPPRRGHDP
jgi:hypothetical protein